MSGQGRASVQPLDASGLRVGVVAARWHDTVMDGLVAGAQRCLADCGVSRSTLIRVPGSFELPVATLRLARAGAGGHDAVVALGVVVRGGTPHFEYVCQAVTDGLTRVALDTGVPVGFGVLTCDNDEQAQERAGLPGSTGDKGYEAAHAAMETALTLRIET